MNIQGGNRPRKILVQKPFKRVKPARTQSLMNFVGAADKPFPVALCDYRVIVGRFHAVARRELPIFLAAPCIIFMAGNEKLAYPELNVGISGQNMNLAALSLGLGFYCGVISVQWSPMFRK